MIRILPERKRTDDPLTFLQTEKAEASPKKSFRPRPLTNLFSVEKSSLLKKVQMRGSKGGKGLSLPFVSDTSCHSVADNADEPFSANCGLFLHNLFIFCYYRGDSR